MRADSASRPTDSPQTRFALAAGEGGGKGGKQQDKPSAWLNGSPKTEKQKLQALKTLAEAAKTAGADEAAQVLANNAQEVQRAAQENKPLGARLDSARARLAKAKTQTLRRT